MKTILIYSSFMAFCLVAFAQTEATDSTTTKDKITAPIEVLAQHVAQTSMLCTENHQLNRTISVTGIAEEKMSPDMVRFYVQVNVMDKQTSKGTQKLTVQLNEIQQKLGTAGFSSKDMKQGNFAIVPIIEYESGKQNFVGYQISQSIEITFEAKRDKMDKLINTLSAEDAERISVSFIAFLSDEKMREAEKRLIKKAIKNATENAEIIAEAAKLELGQIAQITYGNPDHNIPFILNEKVAVMQASTAPSSNISKENVIQNLNLEDIHITKSVSLIYNIKNTADK